MTIPVDVLIIGAGASGAAVAWSLAETKMHILCLEQGDWMKPSEYPSTARRLRGASVQRFPHQSQSSCCAIPTIRSTTPTRRSRSPISAASGCGDHGWGLRVTGGREPFSHPGKPVTNPLSALFLSDGAARVAAGREGRAHRAITPRVLVRRLPGQGCGRPAVSRPLSTPH